MKILIQGPHGAGKSTLVRRVMSSYERRRPVLQVTNALPGAYELTRSFTQNIMITETSGLAIERVDTTEKLLVLGNYELDLRDRHGVAALNRDKDAFLEMMRLANLAHSEGVTVLAEGGFLTPRRVLTDVGREFSRGLIVVWLEPPTCFSDAQRCRGVKISQSAIAKQRVRAKETTWAMVQDGASVMRLEDREEAYEKICSMISPTLTPTASWSEVRR